MTSPPVRYLVLWLTTACNLRCRYCYRPPESPEVMPRDVAKAALALAASSGAPFHVQLAGGEPTLEPGLIEFVGRTVREAQWRATIAIQTNATLVDRPLIDLCLRYDIRVGASVDGPPDVQEQLRGGAGATFRGLALLEAAQVPVRVTAVLSSTNAGRLSDLAVALARFSNIRGVGLDPLVMSGRAAGAVDLAPSAKAVASGARDFLEAMRWVERVCATGMQWRELEAVRKALFAGGASHHYCHACTGESLGVRPDGTVYPCGQTMGDVTMGAGTIERIEWDRLKGFFHGKELSGDCRTCSLNGRCPGDCPSRLHYNGGVDSAMCAIYRRIAASLAARERTEESPNHKRSEVGGEAPAALPLEGALSPNPGRNSTTTG